MKPTTGPALLLHESLPLLYEEMLVLIEKAALPELAAQLPTIRLIGRCDCEDYFCSTIYTGDIPTSARGTIRQDSIDIDSDEGSIVIDTVDRKIVCIEILYRDDIRAMVRKVLP